MESKLPYKYQYFTHSTNHNIELMNSKLFNKSTSALHYNTDHQLCHLLPTVMIECVMVLMAGMYG